jgi:hypothetical protein
MRLREQVLEDVALGLEYNPRRGGIYLLAAGVAFLSTAPLPGPATGSVATLVLDVGGAALLILGIFHFRKRSSGIVNATTSLFSAEGQPNTAAPEPHAYVAGAEPLRFPVATLVRHFAAGPLLLGPLFIVGAGAHDHAVYVTWMKVIGVGGLLYSLGLGLEKLTAVDAPPK